MRISDWSSDVCSSDLSVRNIRSSRCLEDQPTCPRLQPLRPYGGQTARRGGRSGGSPKVETAIGVFEKQYRPENTGTDSPNWVSENINREQAISQQVDPPAAPGAPPCRPKTGRAACRERVGQ